MNAFQKATADCARSDCELVKTGMVQTLIAWTAVYDKNGNESPSVRNPNITYYDIQCMKCGKAWKVEEKNGDVTVTAHNQAP